MTTDAEVYYWCSHCRKRHGQRDSHSIAELNLRLCRACYPQYAHLDTNKTLPDVPGQRLGD